MFLKNIQILPKTYKQSFFAMINETNEPNELIKSILNIISKFNDMIISIIGITHKIYI